MLTILWLELGNLEGFKSSRKYCLEYTKNEDEGEQVNELLQMARGQAKWGENKTRKEITGGC